MIKITVFSFKDILKHIHLLCFIALLFFLLCFFYNKYKINLKYITNNIDTEIGLNFEHFLDENIPGILEVNKSYSPEISIAQTILYSELPIMKKSFVSEIVEPNIQLDNSSTPSIEDSLDSLTYADTNVQTEVLPTNVPNNYTNEFEGVEIKNGTDYILTDDILSPSSLEINKKDIIIFHTHTCESYTPSELYQYEESGNFRTTDLERSVVKVGSELTNYLLSYGYNVIHDCTYHDYPSYSGSYGRSMATVENILTSTPGTDIIIDIHRDAIGDTSYNPSVKIGDEVASQLMFVIGTDGGGSEHPNWQNNLKFAIKVQSKANELYPGLFKPIILRNSRYNQQLGNAACIIEVGATGNTLDESIISMKYLAKVLKEVI